MLLMGKTLLLISILVSEIFIIVKILDDLVKAAKQCGKSLHTIDISGVDPRLRDSVSNLCPILLLQSNYFVKITTPVHSFLKETKFWQIWWKGREGNKGTINFWLF
jgi:hypothetical protein